MPFSDADDTTAVGINDKNNIVGNYVVAPYYDHGFLLKSKHFAKIVIPDAQRTIPRGINFEGEIVGGYLDPQTVWHGFKFSLKPPNKKK